jgi:hypothetical protein
MSQAGLKSSRGDVFQTLMALEWTIKMLLDPEIEWLEIDSTLSLPGVGLIPIDDIVIQHKSGHLVCCQCKKNEPGFKAWTVSSLGDELKKAGELLRGMPTAEVRFYSRADFGSLQSLKSNASGSPDAASFEAALGSTIKDEKDRLAAKWDPNHATRSQTLYAFLGRTAFEFRPSIEELELQVTQRLAQHVTRPKEALQKLWYELDHLGAHLATAGANSHANVHRLTREQAFKLLQDAGCEVAAPRDEVQALQELRAASAVGRSWRRDVGGHQLSRAATDELLKAVDAKHRRLLLTDGPGAGKTCILLDLVDRLEERADIATLFIQTREFAEAKSDAERATLGLPEHLPAIVSSLSVARHVVVVMDSLDVLALARENTPLTYFLSLVDRLATIPNTTIVVACRAFDLKYDRRLAARIWDVSVVAGALDWKDDIAPVLAAAGAQPEAIDETTRTLLSNARHLALYVDLIAHSGTRNVSSTQELTEAYLDEVVLKQTVLGQDAMLVLESMAKIMLDERVSDVPRVRIQSSDQRLKRLQSEQVILPTHKGGRLAFGHQTLLDALAVRGAIRTGLSLLDFIRSLPAVPFVRPAVRAYFNHLRLGDEGQFRKQLRAVFDSGIAYHLKRLLAESLAASDPTEGDWHLLAHLEQHHTQLFRAIFALAQGKQWYTLFKSRWLPRVLEGREVSNLERYVSKISSWSEASEDAVVEFWISALCIDWIDPRTISGQIGVHLQRLETYPQPATDQLLGRLIDLAGNTDLFLSSTLMRFADRTGRGEALIWRFVTERIDGSKFDAGKLRLGRMDQQFLAARFIASNQLLDAAISSFEAWSRSKAHDDEWREGFIRATSFDQTHSVGMFRHKTDLQKVVGAVEDAVMDHARRDTAWWHTSARRLALNADGGLRHIALIALTSHSETSLDIASDVLVDARTFARPKVFELGRLIERCLIFLNDDVQESVSKRILEIFADHLPNFRPWVEEQRLSLLSRIPAPCRTPDATKEFLALSLRHPAPSREPEIISRAGAVHSPYSSEELNTLDNASLLLLLTYSVGLQRVTVSLDGLTGGVDHVEQDVRHMATANSRRFLDLLRLHWSRIPPNFRTPMLEGAVAQLRSRFGNVRYSSLPEFVEKLDGLWLEQAVRDELQRHDYFWSRTAAGAEAVLACSHVVEGDANVESLLFLAAGYVFNREPECWVSGDHVRLNSIRGHVVDGMTTLLGRRVDAGQSIPVTLRSILHAFSEDCNPQIRSIVLTGLPRLLLDDDEFGWGLFDHVLDHDEEPDWSAAEDCFYVTHTQHYGRIRTYLDRARASHLNGAREMWARISGLAVLSGQLTLEALLDELATADSEEAWSGAMQVWVENLFQPEHRNTCLAGLQAAVPQPKARQAWVGGMNAIFGVAKGTPTVPLPFLKSLVTSDFGAQPRQLPYNLDDWLMANAESCVDDALELAETIVVAMKAGAEHHFDIDSLGAMLTAFFREAEDREEIDNGVTLRRVIALQDAILELPNTSIESWLRAAERPEHS